MKQWMKAGIGIAVLVLAIAAGTGAYAMRGDGDGSPKSAVADEQSGERRDTGGASTMGMCAEGVPDCNDMIVEDGGDAVYDKCPPDMACIEPWLMDPPACAGGVTLDECFPEGVPANLDCYELESFPVQVVCNPAGSTCGEPIGPIEILPLPYEDGGEDPATDGPAVSGPAPDEPVTILPAPAPGELVDPIDDGTTMIAPAEECPPLPDKCTETNPDSSFRCLPPDCAVSSDGSIACPDPCVVTTDPMAGIAENECETLPSDCVTYEDGSVACPGSSGEGEPGCIGGPAVDCGPVDLPLIDPSECIGGPAIDCPAQGETQTDRDARELE